MGLDMFLEKHTYIFHGSRSELRLEGRGTEGIKPERVKTIIEKIGYWRKANAVHQWFVEHVQGGDDNCQPHYVAREQIAQLLGLVERVLAASELVDGDVVNGYTFRGEEKVPIIEHGKVIKDPSVAQEFLPTQDGFFFGGADYDEYYVDKLVLTKEICTNALAEPDGVASFYYRSSW